MRFKCIIWPYNYSVPQICVRTMAKCDAILPLMAAMKKRNDILHTAAETIKKMYDLSIPDLVVQVGGACLGTVCWEWPQ